MTFRYSATGKVSVFCAAIVLLYCSRLVAQQTDNTILSIERNKVDKTPTSISFSPTAGLRADDAQAIFRKYLGIDGIDVTMVPNYSITTQSNATTKRFNQFYKGIQVAYASYSLTGKNGMVDFITGNYYSIGTPMTTTPALSESDAFSKALEFVGADKYMWQDPLEEQRIKSRYNKADTSFLPKGILKWIEDFKGRTGDRKLHLAYSFSIYAQSPLSRQEVYVDAVTGKILYSHSLIKHTAATAATRYSGTVNIVTSDVGPTYRLYDSTRGNGVHTLNMNNGSSYGAATNYNSVTNTWPLAPADSIALDAHWGAEVVYDYFSSVHGRLSYDNANSILLQYVHYQTGYNNAFWNGSEMTYGDGTGCSSGFTPMTSLDVTAHEIGHGVCEYTAGLVYEMESGAMNESFSDCWGATIEAWGDPFETDIVPKSTWRVGEELKCGTPLRRMDFPKLLNDPDTYGGTYWVNQVGCIPSSGNDQCGVHTNSGVMNKWYYLVVAGGSGTNDLSNAYSVTGIGFADGANILYQSELALSSTADYALMRTTSINAALTLFGPCSPQLIAVTDAWYAVGVGPAYVPLPAFITGTANICTGATSLLSDATPGGTWSSGNPSVATVTAGGLVTGIAVGTATITYTVGTACDATRIVTVNDFPVATISPASTATFCTGGNVLLTAGSGPGYTYQWQRGGINIPGATSITYSASIVGSYTVNVYNSAGCMTTSVPTVVSVATPPGATITPSSSTTFCDGGLVVLNANPGTSLFYQWYLGGIPIPGATDLTYTATVGGNYLVVVTNISGCSSTSVVTPVVVNPLPPAISGTTALCVSLTTVLSNGMPGGTWSSSNPSRASAGATTGVITGVSAGTANITYTLGTGCYITTPVTVNSLPVPVSGASNLCMGLTTVFSEAVAGGTWSSSSPAVAFVDPGTGIVTGSSVGAATITYTLGAGCFVVKDVTVDPLPAAITGVANVCVGATTTLSSTTPGGSWTSSSPGTATVVPIGGMVTGMAAGIAGITYTLPTGCIAGIPVTVNTVAAAPITGAPIVCVGQTIALADATPGGVWASSNPGVAIVNTSGSVIGISAGSVTISYTVTNACGSATAVMGITVHSLPVVAPITGTTTICSGSSTMLADATVGGVWSSSNPAIASVGSTGVVSAIAVGAANISYTYTNSFGCSDAAITVYSVTSPFTATATPAGPTSFCTGASVLLNASTGVGMTYQWKKNGANIIGATGTAYTASTIGNYTVLITMAGGCNALSPAVFVNVDPAPIVIPSVTVAATPGFTLCSSATPVSFTATSYGGGSAPVYQWFVNSVAVGAGPTYSYTPVAGDLVSCLLTSNATCAYPLTATSSGSISVDVPHTPTVSIVPGSGTVCMGDMVTYTAATTFGGSAPVYSWTLNGIGVGSASSYTFAPSNGDVLLCSIVSNYPCLLTSAAASPAHVISVQPMMPNTVTIYASKSSIAPGTLDTFVAVAPYAGSSPSYQWRVSGVAVPGATTSIFITSSLTNGQEVSCEVTSSNPCVFPRTAHSSGVTIRVWGVGVQQVSGKSDNFSLLPNPNKGEFTIKGSLSTSIDEEVSVVITDVLGQSVHTEKVQTVNGSLDKKVKLAGSLANGTYLVRIISGNGNVVFHMILDK